MTIDHTIMTTRDEIIIWFNIPPKVEKGAFNYLSKHWPSKVYYVILNDLAQYRKNNGWDDSDFGNAEVIRLWEEMEVDDRIKTICMNHPRAIHIINGFTNTIQRKVRRALKGTSTRIGVYTERPNYLGGFSERLARRIGLYLKYTAIRFRDDHDTDFVLPLGEQGMKAFASFGWSKDKLYRFMYNPNSVFPNPTFRKISSPIRFVYVGRFSFKTKGVDILMKACSYLYGSWTLDFVGGYGIDSDKVLKWINAHDNTRFIGSWKADQVVTNLQDYDVVIVPSKYDGWNLLVNESIASGIGCISSDETVSHELIATSGAGGIYHWRNPKELAKLMQLVIDNPEIAQQWKSKAYSFRPSISSESVGEYLIEILNYVYYRDTVMERNSPRCPWL